MTPIDRSTGPARGSVLAATATLGQHARRFLLLSAAVLLAACSQLKLGYNNADTLLAYSLDSYLKLDDEQEKLARQKIGALHRWHRGQLGNYVQLLDEAQARVGGPVAAADVLRFNADLTRLLQEVAFPSTAAAPVVLATTAAVMAESAADNRSFRRTDSMYGPPRKIHRKHGTNVTHVTRIDASVPARNGLIAPGSRKAPMNPTNCTTWMSGPGVVSAIPSPSSISPGASQP